jgi:hypothetical protein
LKKQDIIISDDALTKEQKEKLEQEFFERQQKELHKGRLFLTASVIALYANAVITAALYPLYLRNLLRSIFFITNPKKPDDFALPESAIMFITVLIIFIILCINIGMAIASNICAAKKKGARPAAAVSFILAEVINLLITVMQLSSALTYGDTAAEIAMFVNILFFCVCAAGIYITIFKSNISDYTYAAMSETSEKAENK